MGNKASGGKSAKQLATPWISNMHKCLKQQVQHLKVKKVQWAQLKMLGKSVANSN